MSHENEEIVLETNQQGIDDPIDVVNDYLSDHETEKENQDQIGEEKQVEHIDNDESDHEQLQDIDPDNGDEEVKKDNDDKDDDDDDDDDFDDFNEADFQQAHHDPQQQAHNVEEDEEDEDDDFGDFDDVEYSQDQNQQSYGDSHQQISSPTLPTSIFSNSTEFSQKLSDILDDIFLSDADQLTSINDTELLNERSEIIYKQISTLPYLHPPNWIKLNIRHNLLIKLGIPINLDELNSNKSTNQQAQQHQHNPPSQSSTTTSLSTQLLSVPEGSGRRRSSISAKDINWANFIIPKLKDLEIDKDTKSNMIKCTNDILTRVEMDNLSNISQTFLQNSKPEVLDEKLNQLNKNYQELITLSSVWLDRIDDLQNDFEIYENVVQSYIGYSQKLRRDEIFENLKKVKHTKKKKKLWNK